MKKKLGIGVDIGGTNTDFGLVDAEGNIVRRGRLKMAGYDDVAVYVKDLAEALLAALGELDAEAEGIGIGAPNGNFHTSCIEHAPNLKFKGIIPLSDMLRQYINVPVTLSNDANAAAYGELIYGGAKGMKDIIMFTLGTGVGSGVIVDGKLVHGFTGCAGELGHAILVPEGRLCTCGRRGCLEEYASARGICQTFDELRRWVTCYTGKLANIPLRGLDTKLIADAAYAGDEGTCPGRKNPDGAVGEILPRTPLCLVQGEDTDSCLRTERQRCRHTWGCGVGEDAALIPDIVACQGQENGTLLSKRSSFPVTGW